MKELISTMSSLIKKKIWFWILGLLGFTGIIFVGLIIIFVSLLIGILGGVSEDESEQKGSFGYVNLSPHVLQYKPLVEKYAKQEGIEKHVPVILAIMQQESGGSPNITDPMQASESLCGYVGCIKNPELSIKQGVNHFNRVLKQAKNDLYLTIHSYNFGSGFINYVKQRNGKYTFNKKLGDGKETYDLAIKFSQEQYQYQSSIGNGGMFTCLRPEARPFNACYGDILYVWSVIKYVTPQSNGVWKYPIAENTITSPFGLRTLNGVPDLHEGVDFGCVEGVTTIHSVDNGEVVASEFGNYNSGFGGYGNVVLVKHNNNLYSLYAHMSSRKVSVGDKVKAGQQVGMCGNTGNSTGPHLHLEARTSFSGGKFDPITLLKNKGSK